MYIIKRSSLYLLILTVFAGGAEASVTVGGTRVIYDGSKKETSLSIENKDSVANLVQSWISPLDAKGPSTDAIIITPPLFRLNAGEKNVLRIVRSGLALPDDKESMYWLNVKGIPATNGDQPNNSVQIAVNSRIKLIYRPKALKDTSPENVTGQLSWNLSGDILTVSNPTKYYMNFASVKINGKEIPSTTFVAPGDKANYKVPHAVSSGGITWRIYNDFGMAGPEHKSKV